MLAGEPADAEAAATCCVVAAVVSMFVGLSCFLLVCFAGMYKA